MENWLRLGDVDASVHPEFRSCLKLGVAAMPGLCVMLAL